MELRALLTTRQTGWIKFGISLLAINVAGCSVYDTDALPAALYAKTIAYAGCDAALSRNPSETNVTLFNCYLEAESGYANAINLQRMDLFRAYSATVRRIAVDADLRLISTDARNTLFDRAFTDYRSALSKAVTDAAAAQSDLRNILGAAAVGAAAGYAERGERPRPAIYDPAPQRTSEPTTPASVQPQMAPNGTFVSGGGTPTLCPDGTYVAGSCRLAPNGKYVGD